MFRFRTKPRFLSVALCALFSSVSAGAQDASSGVVGKWEGTLGQPGAGLRLVLQVNRAADGLLFGSVVSVDQGNRRIRLDRIEESNSQLQFEIDSIKAKFVGTLSEDTQKLVGTWTQSRALPLEFARSTQPSTQLQTAVSNAISPKVALEVPMPPTPVRTRTGTALVYELSMWNPEAPVLVTDIELVAGTETLARWNGNQLISMMRVLGGSEFGDTREIGARQRAVFFVWMVLADGKPVPESMIHKVTFYSGQSVEGGAMKPRSQKPLVIGPPLRGSDWIAGDGPGNLSGHRDNLIVLNGTAKIPERFAIDWGKRDSQSQALVGDRKDNKNYFGYGAEVLAVADGKISRTRDGMEENFPGASPSSAKTLEAAPGNFVMLDFGDGRYALYAHLQPGSLRVKEGDTVKRGQVLGLLGNSGNSTGPHLHFQVSDANSPLAGEGLPFVFDSYELQSVSGLATDVRKEELPTNGQRIKFP